VIRRAALLVIGVMTLVAMACNATGNIATTTPASILFPSDTPTPPLPSATPTLTFHGTQASFSGTSFVIPDGLGSGVTTQIAPANSDTSGPTWDIHPSYTQFTLQDYPLQGKFFQPQILVYPAQEFAQMHEGAAATIVGLQTLLSHPNDPLPAQLPFLPPFNAAQVFTAQPKIIQFGNGSGIRYLTEFAQYAASANNHDLFYTFQGLTADGANYVVAILPVNAPFLASDEKPDSPVPPDGISFDQNDPQAYYSAIAEKLNSTSAGTFNPSLEALDALVQSIKAGGQQ
jgi:hypothetical protein